MVESRLMPKNWRVYDDSIDELSSAGGFAVSRASDRRPRSSEALRVEIHPTPDRPGYALNCGTVDIWFAQDVHAINYAQDAFSRAEILVYDSAGNVVHRYGPASELQS